MTHRGGARRWRGLLALGCVVLALLLAACGGSADKEVDADEFIRPSARTATTDRSQVAEPSDAEDVAPPPADAADDLDVAEDVIRRYIHPTYGYSLELVCEPFCNASSPAIDFLRFPSQSRVVIDLSVIDPETRGVQSGLTALEQEWLGTRGSSAPFRILDRRETVLSSDGETLTLRLFWELDNRSLGGFLERYHTLLAQVGPLVYFIDAGGVIEDFERAEDAVLRAIESFRADPAPQSRPGRYDTWGFVLPYDALTFTTEHGRLRELPTFDDGILIQWAPDQTIELSLTWTAISEDAFVAEQEIDDLLEGMDVTELERGELVLAGAMDGHYVVAEAVDGDTADHQVAVYAWYCPDSKRSFILQSFSLDSVRNLAQSSIDGFRCSQP